MQIRRWRLTGASIGLALLVLMGTMPVAEGASTGGNGLRISPVRTDVTIAPGKTQTVVINVTNVTDSTASLQAIVNDFVANPNESGEPAILLNPTQYASSHSLKRFVSPISNFTLKPDQEKAVNVNITIPKNAAGGGYYGAVRFLPAGAITTGPNQNVSLAGSVGSLILVKVPGNIVDKLSIASFDARSNDRSGTFFTHSKNIDAVVRFQNEGNIQEQPFGKILLKNRSGKTLASYEINNTTPPGNVLPDSIRKFSIPLKKLSSFGEYKLEGNFGYGSGGQLLSASTTFYVIPLWLILLFVAVVILLGFLVFGLPKLIRKYNDRVIRKAGRR
ncbi:MAG TPA: DUF916 domain-containing protein [Candidatus Saccharimonadales bacterium]|nr:DUF916 domain-containing protein [Candidatus Saccharimonadales bacterium]